MALLFRFLIPPHLLHSILWILILPSAIIAQSREAKFEKLCANYVQSPSANTQKALTDFCETNKKSYLAGLGYFLIGFDEFQKERFAVAADFFSKASPNLTSIHDYLVYYWSESLFKLRQFLEAQQKLADFQARFPDSPLKSRALLLYWEASLALEDPQAILRSATPLTIPPENIEALFYLAQAQESLDQVKEALQNYYKLYYAFPLFGKNATVQQKISWLLQNYSELNYPIPKEWKVTRIEKLFSERRYREALNDLEPLMQSDPTLAAKPQYQVWLGISQFGAGKYALALQTLREIDSADPEVKAQVWFYVAESLRKLDNPEVFKQSIESLEKNFPTSPWLEKSLFSIGNYYLVRRNLEESTTFYQRLLDLFPKGLHAADCHWRISWYTYRLRRYDRAYGLFLDHLSRFQDSGYRAAALYWAARSKESLGQPADAFQIYQALRRNLNNNYYGMLAEKRILALKGKIESDQSTDPELVKILQELGTFRNQSNPLDPSQLQKVSWDDWPRVKALTLIQQFELAGKELLRPQVYGDSPAIHFQAAQLFYRGKNFMAAIGSLRKVFPRHLEISFDSLPKSVWEIFFPINYSSIVFAEANRQKVDPNLLLALIRQESVFDPMALSAANAHGLMQLLPSTARKVAKSMKMRTPTVARLNDPILNIRLGTKYFADLLRKFDGQEDKALASYNAGVERVESWMSEGNFEDSAEFVETIPFSETRNYVKTIYRNYWFYNTLYKKKAES